MIPVDGAVIEEEEETSPQAISSITLPKTPKNNSPKETETESVPLLSGNPGSSPVPERPLSDIRSQYAYVAKTSIDPYEDREVLQKNDN
jgi:hypothetical protein